MKIVVGMARGCQSGFAVAEVNQWFRANSSMKIIVGMAAGTNSSMKIIDGMAAGCQDVTVLRRQKKVAPLGSEAVGCSCALERAQRESQTRH